MVYFFILVNLLNYTYLCILYWKLLEKHRNSEKYLYCRREIFSRFRCWYCFELIYKVWTNYLFWTNGMKLLALKNYYQRSTGGFKTILKFLRLFTNFWQPWEKFESVNFNNFPLIKSDMRNFPKITKNTTSHQTFSKVHTSQFGTQ